MKSYGIVLTALIITQVVLPSGNNESIQQQGVSTCCRVLSHTIDCTCQCCAVTYLYLILGTCQCCQKLADWHEQYANQSKKLAPKASRMK